MQSIPMDFEAEFGLGTGNYRASIHTEIETAEEGMLCSKCGERTAKPVEPDEFEIDENCENGIEENGSKYCNIEVTELFETNGQYNIKLDSPEGKTVVKHIESILCNVENPVYSCGGCVPDWEKILSK